MTKIIQFRNKFDVLYSSENNPGTMGAQFIISIGTPFPGDFGQKLICRTLEEANWPEGLIRLAVPIFW